MIIYPFGNSVLKCLLNGLVLVFNLWLTVTCFVHKVKQDGTHAWQTRKWCVFKKCNMYAAISVYVKNR